MMHHISKLIIIKHIERASGSGASGSFFVLNPFSLLLQNTVVAFASGSSRFQAQPERSLFPISYAQTQVSTPMQIRLECHLAAKVAQAMAQPQIANESET